MNSVRTLLSSLLLVSLFGALAFPVRAVDDLLITELMAKNDNTLADEDGDFSDWIEIYNAGTNGVNLNGWYLTDSAANLTKWRFPATNLAVHSYLVVFASGKDRRIPGRPLHTSFKLNDAGDYLGLVKPDGATVQSAYAPAYPIQVPDVSYGIPVVLNTTLLVSNGAAAKFTVPLNDALGSSWTFAGFSDASWLSVNNGVGFEAGAAGVAASTLIADSVSEFSGNQGSNGWSYGYWDKKTDADGVYQPGDFTPFPRGASTTLSDTNYWNGTKWDWPAAGPSTELTSTGGYPAGDNGNPANPVHWVIRRYVSETNGPLRLSGTLASVGTNSLSANIPGSCGDGVVGHVYVDGTEVFTRAVFGKSLGYSFIVNANLGSIIDFALDPGSANDDRCDTNAVFTANIRAVGDAGIVADTIADWSDSGVQGYRGWTYGYFLKTNSSVVYATSRFTPFPGGTGPHSSGNFWTGEQWQWFDGDPPFDRIGQTLCQPNIYPTGTTNGLEHWVIRRWVSEITGPVFIDWHFSKRDLTGAGATAKIFQNGTQRDSIVAAAGDFFGTNKTTTTFNVQAGDLIDFTVEPGADIVGDLCLLNATIYGVTTLSNQFRSDVGQLMTNINASGYLRIPFTLNNAAAVNTLTLRLKYDDGFVAYLNGSGIATRNLSGATNWNATAASSRNDTDAIQFEEINLTRVRDLLQDGNNVLAIQGLNSSPTDPDFLIAAELQATFAIVNPAQQGYFTGPTPGSVNGASSPNLGPLVSKVDHTPHDPADSEDLYVTARVSPTLRPVGTVRLYYRVMFGSESNIVMLDDGLHHDGAAGDNTFGAVIPNTVSTIGQMVRYYVTAADTQANLSRQPPFPNPTFSAQYFGAVVQNPSLTNPLPVLHLFITDANLTSANNNDLARYPCSIYYLGEFYDNLGINRHGQSSTGFPKKSYDIDFNADHHFLWDPNEKRVDDINLLTTYPDKGHIRNVLSYGTYRDAGSPYHYVVPVRVQTNGGFFGDWHIVENGDENYLKRIGRDPNGALYKMYNTFTAPGDTTIGLNAAEKKTRRNEGNADLLALYNGVHAPLADRIRYMYDNINIAEILNMLAARSVTSDWDCCHKNYYFYRDSDGTGEWEALPWDVDLAFGRNWSGTESYWDDRVYPQNRIWGNWDNNSCFQAVLNMPLGSGIDATRQMYLRRVRTLMDELQQTNGTPADQLHYEKIIDDMVPLLAPDAALDLVKWGTWGGGTTGIFNPTNQYWRTLPQSIAETKTNYMVNRRKFVFDQKMGIPTEFPDAQPTNVIINIGAIDYNPSSGNQAEEYIQLINPNNIAVDISGWTLSGAVQHTFQGGVVIPRTGSSNLLYVVADKNGFRHRATAPKGGMGLYIEGPYKGQLSARGETIILSDKTGRIVQTNTYVGNPSGPQQSLRITEIMYHPPFAPLGSGYEAEDFEYIEFKNIGPTDLNLAGVHFTNGVEFAFPASTLAPGAYVLVARNIAAFTSRYGANFNIAGQYVGILDNGGENLRVDDAVGEKILDFGYDNKWYPITDGPGASLVIVNENADWRTWNVKESWRPSAHDFGSPASPDPAPTPVLPVIINELLTHTDLPQVDAIELLNPNGVQADISGWFLTDDFANPKKFRVPNGTLLPAGAYLAFYESNSFGVGPNRFAFSSKGDEAYLFSGDGTNLTGYLQGYEFGAAQNGISFGRYTNSQTNVHFVAQSALTLGGPNAAPKVGPAVISEINYRPVEPRPGLDNAIDEYVEIANITAAPLPLFDTNQPANTWRLRSGVDFDFPTNVTLPAHGHAVIVSFDPADTGAAASFRGRFSVPDGVPVLGPFSGHLDNTGESIRLYRPDTPETNTVPYILVDQVDYANQLPWPAAADGIGPSLQRLIESAYGNDPTNWTAVGPSAGGPYVPGGTPPTFISQPTNTTAVAGRPTTFSVSVSGTSPFFFQWRFNGINLYGANDSTLTLPNVQTSQAGNYSVIVFNSAGSRESSSAALTVLIPVSISQHPADVRLRGSTNTADYGFTTNSATFTVAVSSLRPTRYQWRYNSVEIPGATSSTLTIPNVGLVNDGLYDVVASDDISSATSNPARLTVLISPVYLQVPLAQNVVSNGSFSVSAVIRGNPPPFRYEWREISSGRATNITSETTNYFSYGPVTNLSSRQWRLVVLNEANLAPGALAQFNVTALPDSDHDGIPDGEDLNPSDGTDAMLDSDGDGMSNLAEYIAGTDPMDNQSYLKIEQSLIPGSAILRFGAISNRTYSIRYTDTLDVGPWSKLASFPARTSNRVETLTVPNPANPRFYNVVTPALR